MNEALQSAIKEAGVDIAEVEKQLEYFRKGFPYLDVVRAASIGDGILKLDDTQIEKCIAHYEEQQSALQVVKFVPASGAASRMFKKLFAYLEEDEQEGLGDPFMEKFTSGLHEFAFYEALNEKLGQQGESLQELRQQGKFHKVVKGLLLEDGLNYGWLPKGLLHFHNYGDTARTPVEEHFAEGVMYALGAGNRVRLHFTVSPEHQQPFEDHVSGAKKGFPGHEFEVSFSQQKKSTDTIAVTPENEPFYDENGNLLFRPAGHGALLENLNDIEADLVFIKNIDNVVPDHLKDDTVKYKKILAGLLLETRDQVYSYLRRLEQDIDVEEMEKIEQYAKEVLLLDLATGDTTDPSARKARLFDALNRPIRACGMVENTGEPGGGPFWVKDKNGKVSLQIGETAQLNPNDPETMAKLKSSTHFSPTDIVCSVRNFKGEKFDLLQYRDHDTGFITEKSKSGRKLKALELPGLWNGSMAGWISLFVEVPLITFNPVKTINDLLRLEHQG